MQLQRKRRTLRAAPLLGCALAALAAASGPAAAAGPEPPDVLLITIDTLRADQLGTYGASLATSPEIDALARQSALFERAIAASAMTAPSHASILTSRYVRGHSVGWMNGTTRLTGAATLAQAFRSQGYDTAAFVGNLMLKRRMGFDPGFSVYDDELPSSEKNRVLSFERIAERTAERARAWMAGTHTGPLFAWIHLQDPHGPYSAPPGYLGRFHLAPAPGEKPLKVLQNDWALDGIPAYQKLEGLDLPSQYRARYADEVFYADHWVGELVRSFDAASPRPAVVLLTADHGESMGEDYHYFSHGSSSTPQVAHVPLLLRAPGIAAQRRREVVSHVDIFPTLLELAGLAPPEGLQGLALGPYLREGRPLPDRMVFCDIGKEVSGYTGDRFLRVRGTERVWMPNPPPGPAPLSFSLYRWDGSGRWERVPLDPSLREPLERYSATSTRMVEAPPLDIPDYEALKLLGYLPEPPPGQASPPPAPRAAPEQAAPSR